MQKQGLRDWMMKSQPFLQSFRHMHSPHSTLPPEQDLPMSLNDLWQYSCRFHDRTLTGYCMINWSFISHPGRQNLAVTQLLEPHIAKTSLYNTFCNIRWLSLCTCTSIMFPLVRLHSKRVYSAQRSAVLLCLNLCSIEMHYAPFMWCGYI